MDHITFSGRGANAGGGPAPVKLSTSPPMKSDPAAPPAPHVFSSRGINFFISTRHRVWGFGVKCGRVPSVQSLKSDLSLDSGCLHASLRIRLEVARLKAA